MLTAKTGELELMQGWFDSDPEHTRVRVTFPINKWAGSVESAAVYFEIEPGNRLPEHTDSAEEILYVVAGDVEAQVGDERGRLSTGDLAVIPAMVPHSVANVGKRHRQGRGFLLAVRDHLDVQRARTAVRRRRPQPGRAAARSQRSDDRIGGRALGERLNATTQDRTCSRA